jgi:K+-sensing histidine kinase KdpD
MVSEQTNPLPGINGDLVLCWVGSTEEPDSVVQVGRSLARRCGGRCHVVVALDSPFRNANGKAPLTPETISRANRRLQKLYGEDVEAMALPGHCINEIRRYASNHRASVIVMGEQALAVERSYGETLHDQAPCTVLIVVPPKSKSRPSQSSGAGMHT